MPFTEADRTLLVEHIRALDAASTITVEAPSLIAPGAVFEVKVSLTGGAGPAVGVALVDRPHRWYARPIASDREPLLCSSCSYWALSS